MLLTRTLLQRSRRLAARSFGRTSISRRITHQFQMRINFRVLNDYEFLSPPFESGHAVRRRGRPRLGAVRDERREAGVEPGGALSARVWTHA